VEPKLYPKVAVREFVANAFIRQNFLISGVGSTIENFKKDFYQESGSHGTWTSTTYESFVV
jgi:hypothetical protein